MERKAGSGRPVTATTQENGDLVEELRPFKRIKTPHMSEVTHQQRTDRAGKLAARFERNLRLIEKCAFQDGKDITLEVPRRTLPSRTIAFISKGKRRMSLKQISFIIQTASQKK